MGSTGSRSSKGIVLPRFQTSSPNLKPHQNAALGTLVVLEPWNRWAYLLVPFQLPLRLPPENVPVIDRRSLDSVPLNV